MFENMLFFRAVPFLILERSLLEKQEQIVPLLSVPFDEIKGTRWSFIAQRGTNCSKLRICSGTNWSFMNDFGTIVPKNAFPSITLKRAFITRRNTMVRHC